MIEHRLVLMKIVDEDGNDILLSFRNINLTNFKSYDHC